MKGCDTFCGAMIVVALGFSVTSIGFGLWMLMAAANSG